MEFGVVNYCGFRILAHRQAAVARMRRREFITYVGATAAVPLATLTRAEGGNANMAVPVVRISLGTFDADKAAIVEAKLMESKASLEAGIRAMRGNLGYYVGIDRKNTVISNVSFWNNWPSSYISCTTAHAGGSNGGRTIDRIMTSVRH